MSVESSLSGTSAFSYPSDIRPLTTLRFFAAAIVVLYHFRPFVPEGSAILLSGFFQKGYLGVDFFFVLSGFILTHAYLPAIRNGVFSARVFLIRRLARIYPLHLVTLLIMVGVYFTPIQQAANTQLPPENTPVYSFICNILLIHGWGFTHDLSFNRPSWSISAEWFAYLAFPLMIMHFLKVKAERLLIIIGIGFCFLWFWTYNASPDRTITNFTFDFSPFRIGPEFVLGSALYLWSMRLKSVSIKTAWRGIVLATAGAALLISCEALDFFIVICFAVIIFFAAALSRAPDGGGWLARPFSVWLGEISYAVYMAHFPVMAIILGEAMLQLGLERYAKIYSGYCLSSALLIFIFAALLHHTIERPARQLITARFTKDPPSS